ncbi:hypothetical protein Nhal_0289 [Nitrosococcus halophilus Nc 4]|uniref:Uncharacterized protein n=1 Tax=Nitrosococcus halophilus (strain Nc4) TaxID=472759 RepID=D5BUT8_NITHN|nr:hypothetical protein Nhal_0289 [Nitrosococcus halophilus Nc 4]
MNTSALIQDAKNRISALTFVSETAIMQLPAPIIDVEIKELTFTRKP